MMKRFNRFTNTKKYISTSVLYEKENFFSTNTLNTRIEKLYTYKNITGLGETSWKLNTEKGNRVSLAGTAFMKTLQTAKNESHEMVVLFQHGREYLPGFKCNISHEGNDKPFSVVSSVINLPMADNEFDLNLANTTTGVDLSTIFKSSCFSTFLNNEIAFGKIIR